MALWHRSSRQRALFVALLRFSGSWTSTPRKIPIARSRSASAPRPANPSNSTTIFLDRQFNWQRVSALTHNRNRSWSQMQLPSCASVKDFHSSTLTEFGEIHRLDSFPFGLDAGKPHWTNESVKVWLIDSPNQAVQPTTGRSDV